VFARKIVHLTAPSRSAAATAEPADAPSIRPRPQPASRARKIAGRGQQIGHADRADGPSRGADALQRRVGRVIRRTHSVQNRP